MTSINTHTTCREQNGQWWPRVVVLLILLKNSMWTIVLFLFILDYHCCRVNPYLKRIILENKSSIHPRAKCTVVYLVLVNFTPPDRKGKSILKSSRETSDVKRWWLGFKQHRILTTSRSQSYAVLQIFWSLQVKPSYLFHKKHFC